MINNKIKRYYLFAGFIAVFVLVLISGVFLINRIHQKKQNILNRNNDVVEELTNIHDEIESDSFKEMAIFKKDIGIFLENDEENIESQTDENSNDKNGQDLLKELGEYFN